MDRTKVTLSMILAVRGNRSLTWIPSALEPIGCADADLLGRVRFHVEHVDMAGAAPLEEENDGFGARLGASPSLSRGPFRWLQPGAGQASSNPSNPNPPTFKGASAKAGPNGIPDRRRWDDGVAQSWGRYIAGREREGKERRATCAARILRVQEAQARSSSPDRCPPECPATGRRAALRWRGRPAQSGPVEFVHQVSVGLAGGQEEVRRFS